MSKRAFQDRNFKAMLRTIAHNSNALLLTRTCLSHYVQGELNTLTMFLQHAKDEMWQSTYGNLCYHCLHDGRTLSNHITHQAIGNYFVSTKCHKKHVLAITFVSSVLNIDESVALLLENAPLLRNGRCSSMPK